MKYVPNLIPAHSRVDIDFSKSNYSEGKKSESLKVVTTALAFLFSSMGFVNIFTRFFVGISFLIIGVALFPKFHQWIEQTLQFKFNFKIKSVFILLLTGIILITYPNYVKEEKVLLALQKAKQEKDKAEAEKIRLLEEKEQRAENEFLAKYYFVKPEEYRSWLFTSKDSINNPELTLFNFTNTKKKAFIRHQNDSIKIAKTEEKKRLADERKRLKKERQQKLVEQKRYEESVEYYNGNVIHTGPRGGRYYINSHGNKTYIRH